MEKYVCSVCGYVYDEAKGIPEKGILPGTKWEDLPADWVCPLCGATKDAFKIQEQKTAQVAPPSARAIQEQHSGDLREMSALEMSVLCSNLARGCEKQYKSKEEALFTELAQYYASVAAPAQETEINALLPRIEHDLETGFSSANAVAKEAGDRGALRALVWSEKVTRILQSLLRRYAREGEAMLRNTGVYVCTICGFLYVGDVPPALCPICKVPSWKFEKVEGR